MARYPAASLYLFALFFALVHCQSPYFSIFQNGPNRGTIQALTASIVVPSLPKSQKNAISTIPSLLSNSFYYQPTLVSYGNPRYPTCNAAPGQWCVHTQYGANAGTPPINGSAQVVRPNEKLQFLIERSVTGFTQKISRNGQVLVQAFNPDPVAPFLLLIGTQCEQAPGTVVPFTYTDVIIRLNKPDPDYLKTAYIVRNLVKDSGIYTTDGGRTYRINRLAFQSFTCPTN